MLKTALEKIGSGLLIGIGAGISVGLIMYAQTRWALSAIEDGSYEESFFKSYGPEAKLSIKSHRPQRLEGNSAFLGQVANEGTDTWSYVQIAVELFDKGGQFIDKCSSHLEGSIVPGETRNFKVSCQNCANNPMTAYDKYTVDIVEATITPQK